MSIRAKWKREVKFVLGRENRSERPKTFKTEKSANDYAEKTGIKNFELQNLKNDESSTKKLKIVVKE